MTTEHIKESLSGHFTGIIANNKGYRIDKGDLDYGVDFQVKRTVLMQVRNKPRYVQDGKYIDLQLKCTTENTVIFEEDCVKYDLEAKNYNDLVQRLIDGLVPLVLILVVLPGEQDQWVSLDEDGILLRRSAYWFRPAEDSDFTDNVATTRISIPHQNRLDLNCFDNFYDDFHP